MGLKRSLSCINIHNTKILTFIYLFFNFKNRSRQSIIERFKKVFRFKSHKKIRVNSEAAEKNESFYSSPSGQDLYFDFPEDYGEIYKSGYYEDYNRKSSEHPYYDLSGMKQVKYPNVSEKHMMFKHHKELYPNDTREPTMSHITAIYSNEEEYRSTLEDENKYLEFYKNGRYVTTQPPIHGSFNSTVFKGKDLRKNRRFVSLTRRSRKLSLGYIVLLFFLGVIFLDPCAREKFFEFIL